MSPLNQLHEDIDNRVRAIRESHPEWLCRQGCDGCCRRLAEIPRITQDEWDLLQAGLAQLPTERRLDISQQVAGLTNQKSRPIICPMLNRANGACLVYEYRPVACRTYGFYVQRDQGLYCKAIESQVDEGMLAQVVWGNHDSIDHRLRDLNKAHDLTEWFERWMESAKE